MHKIALLSAGILCAIAACILMLWMRADPFHAKERRQWKNEAIAAITRDLSNPDSIKERMGSSGDGDSYGHKWLTENTIVCRDASWLVYRAITHKVDPKIHDIFIAKASDGNWYYSDYHFCKDMMVLASNDQPESLEHFRKEYALEIFDGVSDEALRPTWKMAGADAAR